LQQALEIGLKVFGARDPDLGAIFNNLGTIRLAQQNFDEAQQLFERALRRYEQTFGTEHPHYAKSLQNLSAVFQERGELDEAAALSRRALEIRRRTLGSLHSEVADSLGQLTSLLIAMEQLPSTLNMLSEILRIREGVLRSASSETRVQSLLTMYHDDEEATYGLLASAPNLQALRRHALVTALLRKGRAADVGTLANIALHRSLSSPEQGEMFQTWQRLREEREHLLLAGRGKLSDSDYEARCQDLDLQIDELEYRLVAELPALRQLQPPPPDQILSAVARRLPKNGVLVEVLWARPRHYQAKGSESRWGKRRYFMLVLFADQRVEMVDLGEAAPVDAQVADFLAAMQNPSINSLGPAKILYGQIFAKLRDKLRGIRHLYLSLDGTLNIVPFAALHDGHDYLLGQYQFHYLTSGRDLLREPVTTTTQSPLILADPDFEAMPSQVMAQTVEADQLPAATAPSFYQRLKQIPRLAGTRREAAVLQELLDTLALTDADATEQAVRAVPAPVILHIATHGVFLDDAPPIDTDRLAMNRSVDFSRQSVLVGVAGETPVPFIPQGFNPLTRSTLILAGAEHATEASDSAHDGLLTAEEVRSLDLWGTQLVVLSACETGRGTLSAGQGVYGLRRAFLVAGAETLVSSLWSVADNETSELMINFYRKLVREQKPRVGAMEEAMQEIKRRHSHPYYWAPFIVIGQDGPLRGLSKVNP
jgi:CHAT domain-containing protein